MTQAKERICSRCGTSKPLDQFEKRKDRPMGRGYRCKPCATKRVMEYGSRLDVWERRLGQRQARYWARVEESRAKSRASRTQHRYPTGSLQHTAHMAVSWAIRSGKLKRPAACEICGCAAKLHAHHEDYARPLDVRWLCVPCHGKQHRRHPSYLPPEGV